MLFNPIAEKPYRGKDKAQPQRYRLQTENFIAGSIYGLPLKRIKNLIKCKKTPNCGIRSVPQTCFLLVSQVLYG